MILEHSIARTVSYDTGIFQNHPVNYAKLKTKHVTTDWRFDIVAAMQ